MWHHHGKFSVMMYSAETRKVEGDHCECGGVSGDNENSGVEVI